VAHDSRARRQRRQWLIDMQRRLSPVRLFERERPDAASFAMRNVSMRPLLRAEA
jgi:hypothetical protein